LQAGQEMLGTKKGIANSYNSPDSINELDWNRKTTYKDVVDYYKGLINLRKHHPAFRMPSTKMIQQNLEFLKTNDSLVIGYILKDHANSDKWKNIIVLFNGNNTTKDFNLPDGNWTVAVNGNTINEAGMTHVHDIISLAPNAAYVLFQ
jgi:pullulanase